MTSPIAYSTQEAGSRFPAIIREVRDGGTVIVADEGQPAVEIRLVQNDSATVEEKLLELEREGILVRTKIRNRPRKTVEHIPGALDRFLAER